MPLTFIKCYEEFMGKEAKFRAHTFIWVKRFQAKKGNATNEKRFGHPRN
jgi:hypothetical protein